jgi:hypothetical protein
MNRQNALDSMHSIKCTGGGFAAWLPKWSRDSIASILALIRTNGFEKAITSNAASERNESDSAARQHTPPGSNRI